MTHRTKQVPSYLRHAAHDRGYANFRAADGKRQRRYFPGKYGSIESRRAYIEWLAEWQAENAPLAQARAVTIGELAALFLTWADERYRKNGRPTGEAENCRDAVAELVRMFGDLPVADFGPKKLRSVRDAMVRSGRFARQTLNNHVSRIRHVFKWGVAEEFVPSNVLHAIKALEALQYGRTDAREAPGVEPVADEHVDAVLPYCTPTLRAAIAFARHTGARPGEVVALRWRDVNRDDPDCWVFLPPDHKTAHHGHVRAIAIGPRGQAALTPFANLPPDALVFTPERSERERKRERSAARRTPVQPSQRDRARRAADKPKRKLNDRWTTKAFGDAIQHATNRCNAVRVRRAIADALVRLVGEGECDRLVEAIEKVPMSRLLKTTTGELRVDADAVGKKIANVTSRVGPALA